MSDLRRAGDATGTRRSGSLARARGGRRDPGERRRSRRRTASSTSGPGPGSSGWRCSTTSVSSSSPSRRTGCWTVIAEKLTAADLPQVSGRSSSTSWPTRRPGDPFDLAVSFLVLHHIEDTAAALAAIAPPAACRVAGSALVRPRHRGRHVPQRRGRGHPPPRASTADGLAELARDGRLRRRRVARPRSTSRTRVAATRPSCCSAATPDRTSRRRTGDAPVSRFARDVDPRRPSPGRSTGPAGARSGKTRSSRSRRCAARGRATRSSRRGRRPDSRRGRLRRRRVETGGGGGTDFGVPSAITDARPPAGHGGRGRAAGAARRGAPGPSSTASPPRRPPSCARVRAAAAATATRWSATSIESDGYYAREMGHPQKQPEPGRSRRRSRPCARRCSRSCAGRRTARPLAGRTWPPRYAARRIAWHALDHAWEMEDRTEP